MSFLLGLAHTRFTQLHGMEGMNELWSLCLSIVVVSHSSLDRMLTVSHASHCNPERHFNSNPLPLSTLQGREFAFRPVWLSARLPADDRQAGGGVSVCDPARGDGGPVGCAYWGAPHFHHQGRARLHLPQDLQVGLLRVREHKNRRMALSSNETQWRYVCFTMMNWKKPYFFLQSSRQYVPCVSNKYIKPSTCTHRHVF